MYYSGANHTTTSETITSAPKLTALMDEVILRPTLQEGGVSDCLRSSRYTFCRWDI